MMQQAAPGSLHVKCTRREDNMWQASSIGRQLIVQQPSIEQVNEKLTHELKTSDADVQRIVEHSRDGRWRGIIQAVCHDRLIALARLLNQLHNGSSAAIVPQGVQRGLQNILFGAVLPYQKAGNSQHSIIASDLDLMQWQASRRKKNQPTDVE